MEAQFKYSQSLKDLEKTFNTLCTQENIAFCITQAKLGILLLSCLLLILVILFFIKPKYFSSLSQSTVALSPAFLTILFVIVNFANNSKTHVLFGDNGLFLQFTNDFAMISFVSYFLIFAFCILTVSLKPNYENGILNFIFLFIFLLLNYNLLPFSNYNYPYFTKVFNNSAGYCFFQDFCNLILFMSLVIFISFIIGLIKKYIICPAIQYFRKIFFSNIGCCH